MVNRQVAEEVETVNEEVGTMNLFLNDNSLPLFRHLIRDQDVPMSIKLQIWRFHHQVVIIRSLQLILLLLPPLLLPQLMKELSLLLQQTSRIWFHNRNFI